MEKHVVTGGAGFIGSHLVERLLKNGNKVVLLDNMSTGSKDNLKKCKNEKNLEIKKVDILKDKDNLTAYLFDAKTVWHLAANPDVRLNNKDTNACINQNIIATYNILEAMKYSGVKNIVFPSTSTIYGEASIIPTPENFGPLKPISLYGASKLASELLISSYCHTFDMRGWIYRLANVIGERSNHGIIYDFIDKLKKNPDKLEILGDGEQNKSYIHISDCIDAFFAGLNGKETVNIYNVGSEDTIKVKDIAKHVCNIMKLSPTFTFSGGRRGWKGDVPKMQLNIESIKSVG